MKLWQRINFFKELVDNQAKNLEYITPTIKLRTDKGGHKGEGDLSDTTLRNIEAEFAEILECEKGVGVRISPDYYPIVKSLLHKVLAPDLNRVVTENDEFQISQVIFKETIALFKQTAHQHYPIVIPPTISESMPTSWITLAMVFKVVLDESKNSETGLRYKEILQKIAKEIIAQSGSEKTQQLNLKVEKYSKTLRNLMSEYALLASRQRGTIKFKIGIFEEYNGVVKIRNGFLNDGEVIQQFLNYSEATNLSLNFPSLLKQCMIWGKNLPMHEEVISSKSEVNETQFTLENMDSFLSSLSMTDATPKEEGKQEEAFFDETTFLSFLNEYSLGTFQSKEPSKAEVYNKEEDFLVDTITDDHPVRKFFDAVDQSNFKAGSDLVEANVIDPNLTRQHVGSNYDDETAKDTALFAILRVPKNNILEKMLERLVELEITNINQENSNEDTLLEILIKNEYYTTAKKLIERGAVIQRPKNTTALHAAATKGNNELIELLLSKGASVNAPDHCGDTPLHVATENRLPATVEVLLQNGADPEQENHDDETPLYWAEKSRHVEILALFREREYEQQSAEETRSPFNPG